MLVRRKKNRIEMLKDERDTWVSDLVELKDMALHYYLDEYTFERNIGDIFTLGRFPKISEEARGRLEKSFMEKEINEPHIEMGAKKAHGPDGFQAIFSQRAWDVVRPSVTNVA